MAAQTAAQTAAQDITDAMADTFGRSWQWVSPVWYLYVVQGLDADGIADRLEADAGEAARLESAIEQAVQGMRMFRTCDDT